MNSWRPRSRAGNGGRAACATASRCEKKDARTLLRKIAEGTHVCGDPGMQFDTTIHKWHTCKGTGRQNSTNPCSEYVFLDNTACNLASLNLMKFKTRGRHVRHRALQGGGAHLHHRAGNHRRQRELSDQGNRGELAHLPHARSRLRQPRLAHHELRLRLRLATKAARLCGAITAIMTGEAYEQSARMARVHGRVPRLSRCALQRRAEAGRERQCRHPCSKSSNCIACAVDGNSPSRRIRLS